MFVSDFLPSPKLGGSLGHATFRNSGTSFPASRLGLAERSSQRWSVHIVVTVRGAASAPPQQTLGLFCLRMFRLPAPRHGRRPWSLRPAWRRSPQSRHCRSQRGYRTMFWLSQRQQDEDVPRSPTRTGTMLTARSAHSRIFSALSNDQKLWIRPFHLEP
jgi:hypothetical protein